MCLSKAPQPLREYLNPKYNHSIPSPSISIFLLSFQFHLHFLSLYRLYFFFFSQNHYLPRSTSSSYSVFESLGHPCFYLSSHSYFKHFPSFLAPRLRVYFSFCPLYPSNHHLFVAPQLMSSAVTGQGPCVSMCACVSPSSLKHIQDKVLTIFWHSKGARETDTHTCTSPPFSPSLPFIKRLIFW